MPDHTSKVTALEVARQERWIAEWTSVLAEPTTQQYRALLRDEDIEPFRRAIRHTARNLRIRINTYVNGNTVFIILKDPPAAAIAADDRREAEAMARLDDFARKAFARSKVAPPPEER